MLGCLSFLIPDPLPVQFNLAIYIPWHMDQGSVLVANAQIQPEVDPRQLLLRLISQEPIYPT